MKKLVLLLLISLTGTFLYPQKIYINQVGYRPDLSKFVFTSKPADSFYVKEANTGKVQYSNKLELWKKSDSATGLNLYKGDFSSFKLQGNFYISSNRQDTSYKFIISDTVYNNLYDKVLKSYYFQRCGTALHIANAGEYNHPVCHINTDGIYHPSTGLTGSKIVTGGWHDAGDYGKYVINAGISVGTLLMAYEMFPEYFNQDNLNIPESGNNVPDLLDEVKYELDWLFTMQDTSGGVFAKVTGKIFEGFVLPQNDKQQRYIYQITSAATADFAAMMARAYRNYYKFDSAYAHKCLTAAKNAWKYLELNPGIVPEGGFRNPPDTQSGSYGDRDDRDERIWAASELFISTGNEKYHNYYMKNYDVKGIFETSMNWQNVGDMAHLTYIFGKQPAKENKIINKLKKGLEEFCNSLVEIRNNDGLHVAISTDEYYWGSNGEVLNKAVLLIAGYTQTNIKAYFDAALDQLNYVLGVNANNISYITGVGSKSPMNPHHRPSGSDGITNPVPGLIVGGPNKDINNDYVLSKYYNSSTPHALCYLDEVASYASNETCINWNAPLVFVAGFFMKEK